MSIFSYIPENFFSLLASKNKEIYAEALLVLYRSLQSDEFSIKKNDYARTLRDKYKDIVIQLDLRAEEELNADDIVSEDLPSKTAFVIRRLEECGWIDIEMEPDTFEEYIALPSYTISFLLLLNELMSEDVGEYVSLVHSTYTDLKAEDELRDEFMYATLLRAYENTKKLKTELVTLGHSIRIFQNRLGRVFSSNSILSDYFDNYKTKVSDRYYHPLKTFDSVARFKRPIIQILTSWLHDKEARTQLVLQSTMWARNVNKDTAEQEIISKINYICDMFETLNSMIDQIDQKHNEYTKASTNKILYLNNSDPTLKGHLDNIFKAYAQSIIKEEGTRAIMSQMQDNIMMSHQGYIDYGSLTLPIVRKIRDISEPMSIIDFDDVSAMLMDGFLDSTRNLFTDARVFDFMEIAFQDEEQIQSRNIRLPDFDALILLILATIKANDEKSFYTIRIDEGYTINGPFRIPLITFTRKEIEL